MSKEHYDQVKALVDSLSQIFHGRQCNVVLETLNCMPRAVRKKLALSLDFDAETWELIEDCIEEDEHNFAELVYDALNDDSSLADETTITI